MTNIKKELLKNIKNNIKILTIIKDETNKQYFKTIEDNLKLIKINIIKLNKEIYLLNECNFSEYCKLSKYSYNISKLDDSLFGLYFNIKSKLWMIEFELKEENKINYIDNIEVLYELLDNLYKKIERSIQ